MNRLDDAMRQPTLAADCKNHKAKCRMVMVNGEEMDVENISPKYDLTNKVKLYSETLKKRITLKGFTMYK